MLSSQSCDEKIEGEKSNNFRKMQLKSNDQNKEQFFLKSFSLSLPSLPHPNQQCIANIIQIAVEFVCVCVHTHLGIMHLTLTTEATDKM